MKNESVWCWSTPFIGAATGDTGTSGGRMDEMGDWAALGCCGVSSTSSRIRVEVVEVIARNASATKSIAWRCMLMLIGRDLKTKWLI